MKGNNITYFILAALFFLSACNKFEFDPNQSVSLKSAERLNYDNMNRILQLGEKEELTFIVTGDSHLDYDNTRKMVDAINKDKEVDFVIHLGDMTDHGLLKEFEWKTEILQELNVPYLVVIGNHDILSRGDDVYHHMFGATDFAFVLDSLKFIFFNSNSREYDFNGKIPDIGWIQKELLFEEDFNRAILVSHVPFWDKDYDQALKPSFLRLIGRANEKTKILAGFNGHLHNPTVFEDDHGIKHFVPGAVNRRTYLKVTVHHSVLSYENNYF